MGIPRLPNELILMIGEYLTIVDLAHLVSTCRRLPYGLATPLYKRGNEEDGPTALHWASRFGDISLVKLAIARGVEINKPNDHKLGQTALHLAALWNNPEVIRILVQNGASTSAKDKGGRTPLHSAEIRGNSESTNTLLDLGADMMCRATLWLIDCVGNVSKKV